MFFPQLQPVVIKPNRNGCFWQWRRDMRRNQNFLRACKQVLVCCSRSEVDKQSRERCKLAGAFSPVRCARRLLLRSPPPLLVLPSATKFSEFYTKISEYFRAYFRSLWSGYHWKDLFLLQNICIYDASFGQSWWHQKWNKDQRSSRPVAACTGVNGLRIM